MPIRLAWFLVPDLCTKAGAFASYRKKGKWAAAAKQVGLSKADGDRLNDAADVHYTACCHAWVSLLQAAASQVLAALIDMARPVLQRYRDHKRASAQLDFDDLIFAARDLLRDYGDVRRALGQRFAHVLVDEFQDTDPLQTEIFVSLRGRPRVRQVACGWLLASVTISCQVRRRHERGLRHRRLRDRRNRRSM